MASDVPDPGPRPELFEFPFAEARAALRAIRDLADELGALVNRHLAAVEHARVDFEGQTRQRFDRAFEATIDGMQAHQRALDRQGDDLEADIATAEARREASLDARAGWQDRQDVYQRARTAASPGG